MARSSRVPGRRSGITGRSNTVPVATTRIPGRKMRSNNTRLGKIQKGYSGKWRNKRKLKIQSTRLTDEIGNLKVEEIVKDRPVDLYTDIYSNIELQTDNTYDINSEPISFDSELKLNELYNAGTTIISDENNKNNWDKEKFYIPLGRLCLNGSSAREILITEFEDLDVKHLERPQIAPTLDQFDVANIYRTMEGGKLQKLGMTDHGRAHVMDLMGRGKDPNSFKFTIRANHHFIVVVDAFNWIDDEMEEEDRAGITYKWLWSAGDTNYEKKDLDKVVGTSRMLSIENVQREHTGTFTCVVENKYGKNLSFPIDLEVERPGEVREVRIEVESPGGEVSEILTNQFEWIANDASDEHDEKITPTDNKQVYNFVDEDWHSIYYQESNDMWYNEDDNTPYSNESRGPARGDTWEDADEPGTLNNDMGYRI